MKINSLNTKVIYVSNMLRSSIDSVLNISAAQADIAKLSKRYKSVAEAIAAVKPNKYI